MFICKLSISIIQSKVKDLKVLSKKKSEHIELWKKNVGSRNTDCSNANKSGRPWHICIVLIENALPAIHIMVSWQLMHSGIPRWNTTVTDITSKDKEIIYHARKSLVFDEKDIWMKKQSGLFDVTMRAYDGGEVCELVGTYMLSLISEKYNKNDWGLNRDRGLKVDRKQEK